MEFLSLSDDLTRERAVEELLAPSTSDDPESELCLDARPVRHVDAVAAAAVRLRMARHQREHTQGTVTLVLPSEQRVAARLAAMLEPLPNRITLAEKGNVEAPVNYALVPATIIEDSQAAVAVGSWTLDACERAGLDQKRSAFITATAIELADNAVIHAQEPTDPPVVIGVCIGRECVVEIATLDTGRGISESATGRELLRTIPRRALDGDPGFLGQILQRARVAGVDAQVQVLRAPRGCCGRRCSTRTTESRYIPGTTVVVRISGERAIGHSSSATHNG